MSSLICRNAQLYILDEPLGGVDPAARAKILDLIMENHAENDEKAQKANDFWNSRIQEIKITVGSDIADMDITSWTGSKPSNYFHVLYYTTTL